MCRCLRHTILINIFSLHHEPTVGGYIACSVAAAFIHSISAFVLALAFAWNWLDLAHCPSFIIAVVFVLTAITACDLAQWMRGLARRQPLYDRRLLVHAMAAGQP